MLKIERDGNRFKVTAKESGLGQFDAPAKDIEEVCRAVRHYYDGHNHARSETLCPFCRVPEKEDD